MNLKNWLKENNTNAIKFARQIGVHYSMIYYILKGQRRPSPELAEKIENATDAVVSRLELLYPNKHQ